MKKKMISLCLALSLLILLAACSSAPTDASTDVPPAPTTDGEAPLEIPGYIGPEEEPPFGNTGETYLTIDENGRMLTGDESRLTFSLKVDTAAYTNVARYIESGNLPPRDAVRTEELLNYFSYDGDMSFDGDSPFALYTELGPSPFNEDSYLAFIRVKSEEIDRSELPSSNLTFLIDTSGSMSSYDKLPLLQEAFSLLAETLDEDDRVSIVTYAGSSAVVLDGASGDDSRSIISAINDLEAGGSTAGAEGIMTAYTLAEKNFLKGGNNRVILATDGDFNVGVSSTAELTELVGEKRGNGVYMSILGFGTGNIRDDIMETLSKEGNGNYAYINDLGTAKKVLVEELAANLFTIADDVKAQVEFNPENVKSYRLIGYENRRLSNKDFEDDAKDAGEIGAGTDIVLMFELELQGSARSGYKYGGGDSADTNFANELFEVRIRYKDPGKSESKLLTSPVFFEDIKDINSSDFLFASSVAAFGHLLRDSEHKGSLSFKDVYSLAEDGLGRDGGGYRIDYLRLLEQYDRIR